MQVHCMVVNDLHMKGRIQQEPKTVKPLERTLLEEDFFYVKTGNCVRKVFLQDILLIEGQKEYVRLISATEDFLVYKRLKEIERQLPPPFMRIHHSYMINCRMLEKIQEGEVYIANRQVPISEKYKQPFWDFIHRHSL